MFDWTDEKISTVKELWGKEPAAMIGERIGAGKNAVIGKAHRLNLPKIAAPKKKIIKAPVARKPQIRKLSIKEPIMVKHVRRGRCQWIEGDPVKRQISDKGKCLHPTVYRDNGERSPYCLEHTQRAWRQAKLKDIGDVS